MGIKLNTPQTLPTGKKILEKKQATDVVIEDLILHVRGGTARVSFLLVSGPDVLDHQVTNLPPTFLQQNKAHVNNLLRKVYDELKGKKGLGGTVGDDL